MSRIALITGCSNGGIGEEMVKQLHSRGVRVIATARDVSSMESLSSMGIETYELDVTKQGSIDALKSSIEEKTGGKLDILINNAGVSYPYSAADLSMDKVRDLFEVNLFGCMAMTKAFIPLLIASGDARIVHMGSLAGVMPVPFGAAYNASKAALHSYADTLRVELAPFNIKVLTVIAGNVRSNLSKPWHQLPKGSIYEPIRAEYQDRRIDRFQEGASPRDAIVRKIVTETLKRSPRAWLWLGKNSFTCWFVSTFLGRRGFDGIMSKIFSLDKLTRLLRQGRKDV